MNFNLVLILYFVLFLSGCGVKARPLSPPEAAVQSYVQSFTGEHVELKKEKPEEEASPKK